jgi:hypothetical protein
MVSAAPAFADEGPPGPRYHGYRIDLPPERHVVEVVQPPFSGNFVINGYRFTAKHPSCHNWVAGDRIKLVAGDWHARCADAVFYNVTQRSTCETWCGPRAEIGW